MSVVAVKVTKDEIVIGSDSQTTSWMTADINKFAKMRKISDDLVISHVGLAADFALLREFVRTNQPRNNSEDGILEFFTKFYKYLKDMSMNLNSKPCSSAFIIVYKQKAYTLENYYIKEITDFDAIGSGGDNALTALHLGHSVKESIEIACDLNIYCEKPINIITIKKNKKYVKGNSIQSRRKKKN